MDFKDRIEKIKSILPLKFFYEKSFDTNNRTKILSDLKLDGLDKSASILKCGVLLTRVQEFHLFRKYNYLKYRISKLTNLNLEGLKNSGLSEIEKNINKMHDTRNIIMKCNMRLIFKSSTKHFAIGTFNNEEFFSNGYVHMMKAIDYFDHRRGFKFSTYFTNVLFRNLQRDRVKLYNGNCENLEHDPQDQRVVDYRETNDSYNKQLVKEMLSNLGESYKNSRKDPTARVAVIEKYFGIDGGKEKTLREVGLEIGVSRERTRQLVDDGIRALKRLKVSYDPLN
jgi:RNA polymerase sigma factor (sigma-70 family)